MAVNQADDLERRAGEASQALEHAAELLREMRAVARAGTPPTALGTVFASEIHDLLGEDDLDEETVRRAARLAVADRAWQRRVGDFFQTRDVVEVLGVSRQRVGTLAAAGRLVSLQTDSGAVRYPAWQFNLTPAQREMVARVHGVLVNDGHLSPWTAASWLVSPHPEVDAPDPVAAIQSGGPEQVLIAARRDAARAAR